MILQDEYKHGFFENAQVASECLWLGHYGCKQGWDIDLHSVIENLVTIQLALSATKILLFFNLAIVSCLSVPLISFTSMAPLTFSCTLHVWSGPKLFELPMSLPVKTLVFCSNKVTHLSQLLRPQMKRWSHPEQSSLIT